MQYALLLAASLSCIAAEKPQFRKVVPFGDSWFLENMVGGGHRKGWPFVVAEKLGIPSDAPIAKFGMTSDQLYPQVNKHVNHHRSDPQYYGANDLPVIHIGGNDIQPAIVHTWFTAWDDAAQRKLIRSYLQPVVENTANMVQNMCGKPFQVVMVSEPPFSKYLPIIGSAVWSSNLEQLKEETTKMYKSEFQSSKYKDCTVLIFEEGKHLDTLGNEGLKKYVDNLHPDASIHHRLGEMAVDLLRNPVSCRYGEKC
jgi:hypothetical protein